MGDQDPDDDRPFRAEGMLDDLREQRSRRAAESDSTRELLNRWFSARGEPFLRLLIEDAIAAAEPGRRRTLPAAPPIAIPHHELIRCLGVGGFGQVWLARHSLTEHYRAAKLIPAARSLELEEIKRFKQRVPPHPSLFPIEEVGESDGWIYCLMPLADPAGNDRAVLDSDGYESGTLDTYLERHGALPPSEVARAGVELADGLAHLHAHGVTHGDVKPANVLRFGGRWMIADYGLLSDLAAPQGVGHTPHYTPPEGPGTAAADQFALGVVLMQLATGWGPDKLDRFRSLAAAPSTGPDGGPVREVILRATAEAADDRFGSIGEIGEALRSRIAAHTAAGSPPQRWRRALVPAALAVLLASLALFGWLARRPPTAVETSAALAPGLRILSLDVWLYRYDGLDDLALGVIGREQPAARFDDDVSVHVTLSAPGYAYLLALDTDGSVQLCLPGSPDEPPAPTDTLVYPSEPGLLYRLNADPGTQGFLVLASAEPLPSWSAYAALHGPPDWSCSASASDEVWVYDGKQLLPRQDSSALRGEVASRRGGPRPVLDALTWARARLDLDDVHLIAFAVH